MIISGLTFWNSYSERRNAEVERAGEERSADVKARSLVLRGTVDRDGESLELTAAANDQAIQDQTVSFPSALELDAVEVTNPRIEADWFDGAVREARRAARQRDEDAGDERLPVAITTRYVVDGETFTDVALYDVGYAVKDRFLRGGAVQLRGLSFIGRAGADIAQARLDKLWQTRQPTISTGAKK